MSRTLIALLLLTSPVVARDKPGHVFPGKDWAVVKPEAQGLDDAKLREAVDFLKSLGLKDGVKEMLIVRRGQVVWRGDDVDKLHGTWSCTKSFTSTALGLLIADGKCTLDTKVAAILPELKGLYPDVTLRHFTTMTSGYRAKGDDPPKTTYAHGPSATPFVPAEPLFAAGTKYAYWDSAMNVFGLALTKIAGEPLETLLRRRVMDPIGVPADQWKWGVLDKTDGVIVNGGSGNQGRHVQITARQMARFGHLYLNQGKWNGKQLIDPKWIAQATQVQVPNTFVDAFPRSRIDGVGVYGFNWWVNGERSKGERLWPDVPPSAYAALGHNNNKVWILPEWEMVIVRLGLDQSGKMQINEKDTNEFLKRVAAAIQK